MVATEPDEQAYFTKPELEGISISTRASRLAQAPSYRVAYPGAIELLVTSILNPYPDLPLHDTLLAEGGQAGSLGQTSELSDNDRWHYPQELSHNGRWKCLGKKGRGQMQESLRWRDGGSRCRSIVAHLILRQLVRRQLAIAEPRCM
jgi:hypothetical protein